MLYLHLFHGREVGKDVPEHMDWGFDGPVLRIYGFHCTYMQVLRIKAEPNATNDWEELTFDQGDCLIYGNRSYGDWSIFTKDEDPRLAKQAIPVDILMLGRF